MRVDSDAFTALPVSVAEGDPTPGETPPGELLTTPYAGFMAVKLAQRLEQERTPARELMVEAWCRLSSDVEVRSLEGVDLQVRGRAPGLDHEGLRTAARAALVSFRESVGIGPDLPAELLVSLAK